MQTSLFFVERGKFISILAREIYSRWNARAGAELPPPPPPSSTRARFKTGSKYRSGQNDSDFSGARSVQYHQLFLRFFYIFHEKKILIRVRLTISIPGTKSVPPVCLESRNFRSRLSPIVVSRNCCFYLRFIPEKIISEKLVSISIDWLRSNSTVAGKNILHATGVLWLLILPGTISPFILYRSIYSAPFVINNPFQ